MKYHRFLFPLTLTWSLPLVAAEPPISARALIEEVSSQHPELRFYEAQLEGARAERTSVAAWSDPELSIEVGRKRARDSQGALAGEGTAWSVSLAQTFEWPGRLALRKAIANREVALAELGVARFKAALSARVQVLVCGLQAETTKTEAVREVAERFRALKEMFLSRDPAGLTPLLETRVIEAQELAIQRRATEAELRLKMALVELNQLRGAPVSMPLSVTATERIAFGEAPDLSTLLAAARENHFEYRARRLELEQQGYAVQLARNERYPSVTVRPFVTEENAGERERIIGIGLTAPLPLTSRTHGAVAAAEARRRQAEAAIQMAQRMVERELIMAAETFAAKRAEAGRWSPDAVEKFRDAAALADRHYRLGAVPLATYVELQSAYLEATEALLDTQREAMEAGLRVQQLSGLDFNAVQVTHP